MLKISLDPTFEAVVDITVPGQKKTGTIPLTFKYRNKEELLSFWNENDKSEDTEIFHKLVLGWGLDEKFTPENVKVFLNNYHRAAFEIVREYNRLLAESRIKN